MNGYQLGKLKHAFGLDYSKTPWRNYYHCDQVNNEWEDMVNKGYAIKKQMTEPSIVYSGSWKGLQLVFRKNVSLKYFNSITKYDAVTGTAIQNL